ncbi:retrovirus-related pol polyprotein from transposon TNT 1-94, partial [Tanacetum coccineum]
FRSGEELQAKKAEALKSSKAESSNANRSNTVHTTIDHNDIEWFRRGEELQAKKAEALKSSMCDIRKSIWYLDSGCSRHMTGVKSYMHKYVEQSGPKVFDDKRGTIFNSNKEVAMIAPRHKRLAHLNFKTINKLAKQNLVIGLPLLVYSKDKPCSSCEKGKHHRASFKTKHTSSIKKCLHLLHIDLFRLVIPRSINHEKYTLVIVYEYSRYTWVYFMKKKSQAPKTIMSFIKRVENQNDIKVKQLRIDNGTELGNSILINFFYIHNHNDHLGKFDEKANDGYHYGYSLVSKAFKVFNTRRHKTKETYHITFDESPDDIKFSKPLVDNINIPKNERYPPDEYLLPYKPSQRYQASNNDVSFIEPYECPEPVVLETKVSSDQNGQNDKMITMIKMINLFKMMKS